MKRARKWRSKAVLWATIARSASASQSTARTSARGGAAATRASPMPVRRWIAGGIGAEGLSSVWTPRGDAPGSSSSAPNSRISAPASAASPVVSRSTTATGPTRASHSASASRSSPNEPASIASIPRQRASDVDAALVLLVLADLHVDQRRLSGGRGALERGADLLWTLAVLAVPAERLDDLVVAGVGKLGGDQSVPAVDGALRSHHLAPRAVVAHHADDRQLEAHRGVVLEAVQPERAVAVDDDDALARM